MKWLNNLKEIFIACSQVNAFLINVTSRNVERHLHCKKYIIYTNTSFHIRSFLKWDYKQHDSSVAVFYTKLHVTVHFTKSVCSDGNDEQLLHRRLAIMCRVISHKINRICIILLITNDNFFK